MEALHQRKTTREIKSDELSPQVLGELLWAAYGVNRPQIAHRTAPSAMNSQEVDIYVAMRRGVFQYDAPAHRLKVVSPEDVRGKTSGQPFGTNAPVTLLYVADLNRLDKARAETRLIYANFDAGCICQNVYLFCASEGLATVVHDLDRNPLQAPLKLKPEQQIIMAQAVGWPAETSPEPAAAKP
jgi:nitroreductase